jgi:hypothetical protein
MLEQINQTAAEVDSEYGIKARQNNEGTEQYEVGVVKKSS